MLAHLWLLCVLITNQLVFAHPLHISLEKRNTITVTSPNGNEQASASGDNVDAEVGGAPVGTVSSQAGGAHAVAGNGQASSSAGGVNAVAGNGVQLETLPDTATEQSVGGGLTTGNGGLGGNGGSQQIGGPGYGESEDIC